MGDVGKARAELLLDATRCVHQSPNEVVDGEVLWVSELVCHVVHSLSIYADTHTLEEDREQGESEVPLFSKSSLVSILFRGQRHSPLEYRV